MDTPNEKRREQMKKACKKFYYNKKARYENMEIELDKLRTENNAFRAENKALRAEIKEMRAEIHEMRLQREADEAIAQVGNKQKKNEITISCIFKLWLPY